MQPENIKGQLYIDGIWQDAKSGAMRDIINPYNQEMVATVAEGDRRDAQLAIAAARRAFDTGPWPQLSGSERADFLFRLGDMITAHRQDLAELESLDTGKTVTESLWDMADIAGIFRYYAGLADKEYGEIIDSPQPQTRSLAVREPVGVCGQILPWNYPLLQAAWKMAPALAAGCTIVVKPSEITPLTTMYIVALVEKIGFPSGVVNLLLGAGATVGAELAENCDVDLISFTGGIATGKKIMQAASGNVKKICLELGGKNPHIIFADADLETAVDYALNGVFYHAGQICSAGARLMVEASVHDLVVDRLLERMRKIKMGSGFDPMTQMGPLISAEHRRKVERYVEIARKEGAHLQGGGKRPEAVDLQQGFFFEPTLFTGCHSHMRIVQEEVFGPVITVESFQCEEEAVTSANATLYGLAAGFWTTNVARMQRMARSLRFGTVWINDFNVYFTQAPWGGFKQSGLGRELGRMGFEEYTEVKHVFQNFAPRPQNWFGR